MCINTLPQESTFTRYVRLNGEASRAFNNYFHTINHGTADEIAKAKQEWERIEAQVTEARREIDATTESYI